MWEQLEKPWQECFNMAIDSYKKGSIPIGSVIVNQRGDIVSKGRNLINETTCETGEICRHKLSHAEMNALLKVSEFDHPNIRNYVLYTTMEPCPLCFGASVMANIRHIKFASKDGWAGGTNLENAYIKSKKLIIEGPFPILQDIQIALHTVFEIMHYGKDSRIIETFANDSPKGVQLGFILYEDDTLTNLVNNNEDNSVLYNVLYEKLMSI